MVLVTGSDNLVDRLIADDGQVATSGEFSAQ